MNIEKLIYQTRNWQAHARALFMGCVNRAVIGGDYVEFKGQLFAKIIRGNGKVVDLGCVGSRVVTTAGVNYIRDDFNAATGSADVGNFKFHASGTGTNAEAVGDTALQTEVEAARTSGSQSGAVSKIYVTVGTISYTATRAITEHGIFSAATTGTLLDRTVFSAINVVSGDSIQFTYSLTINDGG